MLRADFIIQLKYRRIGQRCPLINSRGGPDFSRNVFDLLHPNADVTEQIFEG